MTPQIKQRLVAFILRALREIGAVGMVEEILLHEARMNISAQLTAPELNAELLAMADKEWVIMRHSPVAPSRWRITELGASVAAEAKL